MKDGQGSGGSIRIPYLEAFRHRTESRNGSNAKAGETEAWPAGSMHTDNDLPVQETETGEPSDCFSMSTKHHLSSLPYALGFLSAYNWKQRGVRQLVYGIQRAQFSHLTDAMYGTETWTHHLRYFTCFLHWSLIAKLHYDVLLVHPSRVLARLRLGNWGVLWMCFIESTLHSDNASKQAMQKYCTARVPISNNLRGGARSSNTTLHLANLSSKCYALLHTCAPHIFGSSKFW